MIKFNGEKMAAPVGFRVLGLDVSSYLGVCKFEANPMAPIWDASEFKSTPMLNRMDLLHQYELHVSGLCQLWKPDLVVIEQYAMGAKFNLATMVEVGYAARRAVWAQQLPMLEVSPTTLKKYVAGSGSAKKEHMMLNVYKRWGVTAKTNNEADAIGLAALGAMLYDRLPIDNKVDAEYRRTLLKSFNGIPPYPKALNKALV